MKKISRNLYKFATKSLEDRILGKSLRDIAVNLNSSTWVYNVIPRNLANTGEGSYFFKILDFTPCFINFETGVAHFAILYGYGKLRADYVGVAVLEQATGFVDALESDTSAISFELAWDALRAPMGVAPSIAISPKTGTVAVGIPGDPADVQNHGKVVFLNKRPSAIGHVLSTREISYARIFDLGGLPLGALPDGPGEDANLEVNTPFTIGNEIEFTEDGNLHLPIHGENHGGGLVLHADVIADFAASQASDW